MVKCTSCHELVTPNEDAMFVLQPNQASCSLPPHQVYRIREVTEIVKVGRSTVYLWISQGKFPKQRKLGTRAVGWFADDIFQWLAEREVA